MWLKRNFWQVPGRYVILFLYHLLVVGAWRAGRIGWVWARLRTEVYRMWEYKRFEMDRLGHVPVKIPDRPGAPDPRVKLYEEGGRSEITSRQVFGVRRCCLLPNK